MAIHCVTREQARRFIDSELRRPQSNKVLHVHPSPMYWEPSKGHDEERWSLRATIAQQQRLQDNFYLGIPYCLPTDPSHCGFCLFPTQDYRGNADLQTYLEYLEREADLLRPHLSSDALASVYVGGGTPNLLRCEDYERIMRIVTHVYGEVPSAIEKTIEGIPQLFNAEKVAAIKDAGFTRVSMGVQQLSDRLIKHSGRKQTYKQVVDALDHFNEARLAVNVDLIYGWPDQTLQDMLNDLTELCDRGVRHITHYQLNIAGRSDFSRARREALPSFDETYAMYVASCELLRSRGFRQATVYDWERIDPVPGLFDTGNAHQYAYEQNLRDFVPANQGKVSETHSMVGVGYAAVSIALSWPTNTGANWAQMNTKSLADYYGKIDRGSLPVERCFAYCEEDMRLGWIFQSMQTMQLDTAAYQAAFDADLMQDFGPIWDELDERGWIQQEGTIIRIVGLGQFVIPMIQALFSSARLEAIRHSAGGRVLAAAPRKVISIAPALD